MWAFDLLTLMNIVLGGILCWEEIKRARRCKKICWIQWVLAGLGIYWAILYTVVLVVPTGVFDPVMFGRIFVRPINTITFSLMVILAQRRRM